jgi:hypothetical protein
MKTITSPKTKVKSNAVDDTITRLKALGPQLPDKRRGKNCQYTMSDIVLGAFSVFFLQCPSFLARQQTMEQQRGRSNANALFKMERTPCDNHIRDMLDPVKPENFYPEFRALLQKVREKGYLEAYRVLNGKHLLISLDGTQYFSSYTVQCEQCTHRKRRNGKVQHYHSAILPVIVSPGNPHVLAQAPEYIIPQDGTVKQDCERAASKRWVTQHAAYYVADNAILMGDDLYANQPLCEHILDHDLHFLFGCKPDSHKTLYAALEERSAEVHTVSVRKWNGKHSEVWTYRYCADLPLRAGEDALLVNWCELHIAHAETDATLYHHTWVTDLEITAHNVAEIVTCARAHWKVENENNNVLKNKGYHLEHNFGHGQQYLSLTLLTLNLLAFLLHTVMHLSNKIYRRLRKTLGRREAFFNDLRALLRYLIFDSWANLLTFMAIRLEIIPAPD